MNVLQLTRAFIAIALAALCLGAGYGVSRLVESPIKVNAPDSQKLLIEGKELFDEGNFKKSAEKYEAALKVFPKNGEAWFMHGLCAHYATDYITARTDFEKSIENDYQPGLSHFNIGCGYSLLGQKPEAIYELQMAVKNGLMMRSHYATDPDLQSLQNEPEIKELLASLQHPLSRFPQAVAMERRIGSWDVFNGSDKYRGTMRSSMALNGYGIEEHLVSAVGLSEESLYLYNRKDNTWTCTFADGQGAIGQFKGVVKDGILQVSGPMTGTQSGIRRITIEFMPEGIIQEKHESAPAAGKPFTLIDVYTLKPSQG
jgi:tetratricopeptide (TPR) repeat protein